MKIRINIDLHKKQTFLAVILISFVTLATLAIAITSVNPGHTSNDVMVSIGGTEKTLQNAIDAFEIGETIFKDGTDGLVSKNQIGWAKINIKGTFYAVPVYNLTESIARIYTNGKTIEGHIIASDAYFCTYDDFRDYSQDGICQLFGYSKGATGNVKCGNTQPAEYRHNGVWSRGECSDGGVCFGQYIEFIDCKK